MAGPGADAEQPPGRGENPPGVAPRHRRFGRVPARPGARRALPVPSLSHRHTAVIRPPVQGEPERARWHRTPENESCRPGRAGSGTCAAWWSTSSPGSTAPGCPAADLPEQVAARPDGRGARRREPAPGAPRRTGRDGRGPIRGAAHRAGRVGRPSWSELPRGHRAVLGLAPAAVWELSTLREEWLRVYDRTYPDLAGALTWHMTAGCPAWSPGSPRCCWIAATGARPGSGGSHHGESSV